MKNHFDTDYFIERRTVRAALVVVLIVLVTLLTAISASSQNETLYLVSINREWKSMELYKTDSIRLDSICELIIPGAIDAGELLRESNFFEVRTEQFSVYCERKTVTRKGKLRRIKTDNRKSDKQFSKLK